MIYIDKNSRIPLYLSLIHIQMCIRDSVFEVDYEWEDTDDISDEMYDTVPAYKYAEMDEVLGGVLAPTEAAKLVAVADGKFADPIKCTASLMNVIAERLPKPANPTA